MAKEKSIIRSSAAEYLIYVASTGETQESIEIRYEDENIWLTQRMMATLYGVDVRTVNDHIKKIYSDCELSEDATIRKFRIVQTEGSRQVSRDVIHYNLQMIIVVDFKVNNERAVQFRKWANGIVKDFTIKGWVMDDERLKNGRTIFTEDYFQKLLDKIREISFLRDGSIRRLLTYMLQLLIMIQRQSLRRDSSLLCRTNFITVFMGRLGGEAQQFPHTLEQGHSEE